MNGVHCKMTTGQAHEFAMACSRNGLTRTDVKLLSTGDNLRRSVAHLRSGSTHSSVGDTFIVAVDYSRSLADMIKAGKYDWVNNNVDAKGFPIKGAGIIERKLTLWHLDRNIESPEVERLITAAGQEPALIEDLLAFGARYPDKQREYPIIALGSVAQVGGYRGVACLDRDGSGRDLSLSWYFSGWARHCRFLARNKLSVT